MGIQINGQTDTISAVDGALTVSGAELPTVTNLNATGIVTATGFVGNITGNVSGNINATGVSTIATLNVTQSNPTNLNVSGVTTTTQLKVGTGVTISSGIVTATGPINLISNPFYQNNQTVSSNYTIPQSVNAMSAGPITISNGITVVISSGGYWKIV